MTGENNPIWKLEFFDTRNFSFLVATFRFSYISIFKIEKKRAEEIFRRGN